MSRTAESSIAPFAPRLIRLRDAPWYLEWTRTASTEKCVRMSARSYNGLPELHYPFHDRTITVVRCGRICLGAQKVNLSQAFAGQTVGIKQVDDKIWLVSFMQYDLGFFDHETCRIESAENPFVAKVSPMSPV